MRITFLILMLLGLGWNVFLIQRDSQLFKAYDVCTRTPQSADCPYKK